MEDGRKIDKYTNAQINKFRFRMGFTIAVLFQVNLVKKKGQLEQSYCQIIKQGRIVKYAKAKK